MGIMVAYSIVACCFLSLATGWYQPKRWHDLNDRTIGILKFGCYFGFLVTALRLAAQLL